MLYIVLAYLMLFAALTNSVCLNNASFFFLFKYFLCQGYELSGEIALKNNHYYYYYYYFVIYVYKMFFSDSLQCACCLTQVHQMCARLNDSFINSLNVDDFYWNCTDCIELSSIFYINDNNSTNIALNTSHCSSFYNEKVDHDINLKNIYFFLTSYFTTELFSNTVHDTNGISITYINCRSLHANVKKIKILLDNLTFVFDVVALAETWINESNANIFSLDGYASCQQNRISNKRQRRRNVH